MALKLEVPWSRELIEVDGTELDAVIGKLRELAPKSLHVTTDEDHVIVKNFFGVNNRVHDVSRYHIDSNRKPVRHFDVPGSRLQIHPQPGSILLLLESPSKSEYQFGNINFPIAPANGSSGENIDRCLGKVLSIITRNIDEWANQHNVSAPILFEPGSRVIVSNPIQFQANLRTIQPGTQEEENERWKELRNKVWEALWENGPDQGRLGYIQLCFRARLNTYRPTLIINACTDDLKQHVTEFVQAELQTVPLYAVGHPASWRRPDCSRISPRRIYPTDPLDNTTAA